MADVVFSLDTRDWQRFGNTLSQTATSQHRTFLAQLNPKLQIMMRERLDYTYTHEIDGSEEDHRLPTRHSGRYMNSVVTEASAGNRVARIRATAPYAEFVEGRPFPAQGGFVTRRDIQASAIAAKQFRLRMSEAEARRATRAIATRGSKRSPLADDLIAWASVKFPGDVIQIQRIVNKVLQRGYLGRNLMRSAFTSATPGGQMFEREFGDLILEEYRQFMIRWFRSA